MSLKVMLAAVALMYSSVVMAAEQQPLPDNQDSGFTRRLQHYPSGSKDVLIFEDHLSGETEGFGVTQENVDANVLVMQKFLEWAKMARERGDILNKDMALVKGYEYGIYTYWNYYQFITGKNIAGTVYSLKVTSGIKIFGLKFTPLNPDEDSSAINDSAAQARYLAFNEEEVKQIIQRLHEFKEGKTKSAEEVAKDYKM